MAEVTDHLGFAITKSTTYTSPYQVAREFSTLDHLTDGRIAFNVVTSFLESAAANLGVPERMEKTTRYDRADEFLAVCYALWEESWADDAIVFDAVDGVFADPSKVWSIDFEGRFFSVPGPHGCEPSPQRTPVIFQAGSSDRGRAFAAKHAEAVFVSQPSTGGVEEYMDDVKGRAQDADRTADSIKVFQGIVPIVGETSAIAEAKYDQYKASVDIEGTLALLSGFLDIELSNLDPDQRIDHIETDAIQGTMNAFTTADPDRDWTVREVAEFSGLGSTSPIIVGDPEEFADTLGTEVGVDGFNVKEIVRPGSLQDFVDLVVPELRARDLVVPDRPEQTLREHLFERDSARLPADHPGVGSMQVER